MRRTAARATSRAGRRLGTSAAVTALALLTGCGQEAPGVAASVDGEQITMEQVDEYASAVCTYSAVNAEVAGQPAEPVSGRDLRGYALDLLVQQALLEGVAERLAVSVPPSASSQGVDAQTEEVIAAMPSDEGAAIEEIISISQRNAALQRAIGGKLAAEEGGAGSQAKAERLAASAVAAEASAADIEVDPRLSEAYAARADARGLEAPAQDSLLAVEAAAEDTAPTSCSDS